MTRRPNDYRGVGEPVNGDVADPASLTGAMQGSAAAYYLVHQLGEKNFARADASAATAFGQAAAQAGVDRSSTSEGWATVLTTFPSICAVAVRSRACSAKPACP